MESSIGRPRPLFAALIRYGFIGAYIALALTIGEFHPISVFPMFTSFTDEVSYFYVARSDGKPVVGHQRILSVRCSELFDLMDAKMHAMGGNYWSNREMKRIAAEELLREVAERSGREGIDSLQLREKSFVLTQNGIEVNDVKLAEWMLN